MTNLELLNHPFKPFVQSLLCLTSDKVSYMNQPFVPLFSPLLSAVTQASFLYGKVECT